LESEGEGSVFAALRLGFPGMTAAAAAAAAAAAEAREGAAGPAASAAPADPRPDCPSSAPQDPSIKIPVAMGCLEALCLSSVEAIGKQHDSKSLLLLDCIQRTGLSATDTRSCFDAAGVKDSPASEDLYQCGVCKQCLPPADAEEKNTLCRHYGSSSSSSSSTSGGGGSKAPSEWQQYVPKGYMPGKLLRTPGQWFRRRLG
jgi:hypothetical protein